MKIELQSLHTNNVPPTKQKEENTKNKDTFEKMINPEPDKQGEQPTQKKIKVTKDEKEELIRVVKRKDGDNPNDVPRKIEGLVKEIKGTKEEVVQLLKEMKKEKAENGNINADEKIGQKKVANPELIETRRKRGNWIEVPTDPRKKVEGIENPKQLVKDSKTVEVKKVEGIENPKQLVNDSKTVEVKKDVETEKTEKIVPQSGELIKKEEKIELLLNKIRGNKDIPETIKEKLVSMVEQKIKPDKIIKELKTEMQRVENQIMPLELSGGNKMESKMEMKEWVDRIKVELKHLMEFRVESENRIRINLNNSDGHIRLLIEKVNNEIIIHSEASNTLKKRVDDMLAEVKIEMRDKNIEVRLDRDKENNKDRDKEQEAQDRREGRRKKDGSDNADEQRRRSE